MDHNTDSSLTPFERLKMLEIGPYLTLKKIEQGGSLQARRLSDNTIQFYWRFTLANKTDRVPIGCFDSSAPPKSLKRTERGFSIAAAAAACVSKALIHRDKVEQGGYREHVAQLKQDLANKHNKVQADSKHTFVKLFECYCDHLKAEDRTSYTDARSMFRLHVEGPFPAIAKGPAAYLTADQITDILRKVQEAGKGRTANKLRAYIRAAYQCAIDVNSLSSIPEVFKDFQITVNPAAQTKRDASKDNSDKDPLSLRELRIYWRLIKDMPGTKGAALRLHMLAGGQRIEQLTKLKKANVKETYFIIYDPKGRPGGGPRRHVVPILPMMQAAIDELKSDGEFVFSTDKGETALYASTLSKWAQKKVAIEIANFKLKRVRSGVETALAASQVSRDIRGQLQSHGVSGVQAKHYDDHDYLPQKRQSLMTLLSLLEAPDNDATEKDDDGSLSPIELGI
mgnify:FL=1